jgi:hypothetical protein
MNNNSNWIYMTLEDLIDWDPKEKGENNNDATNDDQVSNDFAEPSS